MLQVLDDIVARVDAAEPGKVALRCGERQMTYRQLVDSSSDLAAELLECGLGPGDRAVLLIGKSVDTVAAILACIRAGVTYVPVDVTQPLERIHCIISDCEPAAVITSHAFSGVGELPSAVAVLFVDERPVPRRHWKPAAVRVRWPEEVAFILYTSGSTGTPKGVQISHRNLITFINWCLAEFDLSANDAFANLARFNFDLSTFDLFAALAVGGSLRIFQEDELKNPLGLARTVQHDRLTVWYSVPSILRLMLGSNAFDRHDCSSLRYVLFAGEVFPIVPLRAVCGKLPQAQFYNLYGPTETNVCTYHKVGSIAPERTQPLPIGKPLPEVRYRIDVTGELLIEGPCVTPGYWKRNGDRNTANHKKGVHGTGDLVSLQDGELIYHGRLDDMVKVDGFRVELGEIEHVLAAHPAIDEVAVVPVEAEGRTLLYACYVAPDALSILALKKYCAQFLPKYMIPHRTLRLGKLPTNPNGKTDRKQLVQQVTAQQQVAAAGEVLTVLERASG